jgi:REP element-mobilizing transposase RayT
MVRFRRIADRDRIFFLTTNLAQGVPDLSPAERDLLLYLLSAQRIRDRFLLFGYVVMPDHVHLLLAPREQSVIRIMRDLKSKSGFEIARRRCKAGPLWQERYFDNIIRRVHHFWEKLEYMHQNPVEAKLVQQPEDWEWSSCRFYARCGSAPVVPDPVDLPANGNALLWPAPWR